MYPPKPAFPPLTSNAARERLFGTFSYEAKPLPGNPENIAITGGWRDANIIAVTIPELAGVDGAPKSGRVYFHRLAAEALRSLWAEWGKAGLLTHVRTWGGSFTPRFVRGSRSVLSNHAFGSAFDINAAWNPLGREPARRGEPGCVRDLVAIANEHGFYWGGHFSRQDGMHFEVARLR